MGTSTHADYPELVQRAEARGVEPGRARQIVDEAARKAKEQVFVEEHKGRSEVFSCDLATGRPRLEQRSDLADLDAHLEMIRHIRVGELVDGAIAGELGKLTP